nr:HTTM domain-containing protein [Candidatus Dadabacteria bacterium]NIQ14689.1 HTTM domain-containing protein [Candidatus Dadabacteria bacterium]
YLLAISTFLCSFTPCGKSYSLDRYLEIKKAIKHKFNIPAETGNLFGLRLLSLQLAAVYFWTAFDKSTITWITGQKMEVNFMFQYTGSSYPDFPGFHLMMVILALAVLILEYALSVGLFFKITRKILIIPGIILHCIIYITLPVKTFTATVILLYLSFFDSDEVHKFIDKISGFIESGKNQRL